MTNPQKINYSMGGVYKITNLKTNEIYIGSTVSLMRRRNSHFLRLKSNSHYNKHLQSSYSKYGEEFFEFSVILVCEPFELLRYEQFFIDSKRPEFNKRIIAESNRGRKLSNRHKNAISLGNKGKQKPKDFGEKIRKAKLGSKWTESQRENFKNSRIGMKLNYPKNRKPFSDEYKKQQSIRIKNWWAERKKNGI